MFHSWISSLVPNDVKCLAQAVPKLWALNRNSIWRPAAILEFDFGQFLSFRHVPFLDIKPCAKLEVSRSSRSKVMTSEPKSKMAAGGLPGLSSFVNFGNFVMFPPWISSPVPNLKCLAQAVQKLWPLNRNPRWRPAATLDFDFCQFWWFRHVPFVDL